MLDRLERYGLTKLETQVYYRLLHSGTTSPSDIAEQLVVHRSEVYRVLRRLAERGLVTEHKGTRPILFTATPAQEVINILLRERTDTLQHLTDEAPELAAWLNSQTNMDKAKQSVLLIDDNESIRKALSRTLGNAGFIVDTAQDGREALEKCRLRLYHLALVDIRLPDIEGIKLLRMLREQIPGIKEIIITGYPSVENAIQAVNDGADAYFVKPFNPSDLLAEIGEKLKQ